MPVYRYQASIPASLSQLQQHVPGAPAIGNVGPLSFVDVTLSNAAYKADLDGYMGVLGYAYISTAPTDTPLNASQLLSAPLQFAPMTGLANPASGNVTLYNDNWARPLLAALYADGTDAPLQPHIGDIGLIALMPGNGAAPSVIGGIALTTAGTLTHPVLAATNIATQSRRFNIAGTTTSNTSCGIRGSVTTCWRGNAAGLGGFHLGSHFNWPSATLSANQRFFVGLIGSTAAPSGNPSAFVNMVGIGCDSGDANLQLMVNAGSGTATKIDLGANFVESNTDAYELFLYASPNGSGIDYKAENRVNGAVATGTLTTNLPVSTVFLTPHVYANNGLTAGSNAASIDISCIYLETNI